MKKIEENQEESKFMKLWHNKRTHAAMVLGMWLIFLLFVCILSFAGGRATNNKPVDNEVKEEEKVTFKDYTEMQSELLKKNYNYEYSVTINDFKVVYKGEKIGLLETGYKETSEETIRYYVDETGLYKISLDELYSYDKLYENVNENFIDVEFILNDIATRSVSTEELPDSRVYTYNYDNEGINYNVVVKTDLDNITDINVTFEDKVYELKFSNINSLEKLSYEVKEVNE